MLRVAARSIEEQKTARLVAVTGVVCYIGGRRVPRLLEAGLRVRALVQSPEKISGRSWSLHPNLKIRQVDLSRMELTAALQGCEAAYCLVCSMLAAQSDYDARDLELAETFAQAASPTPRGLFTSEDLVGQMV